MTKKMAAGGKASSYEDMTAGSGSGLGRLQKTSIASKTKAQKLKVGGKVKGYAAGGAMTMDEIIAANQKLNPNFKLPAGYEARARLELENQAADRSPERLAYLARQDKREADAAAKKRAAKLKSLPANRTGPDRIQPYSNTDAQAKRMSKSIVRNEDRLEAQNFLRNGGKYALGDTPEERARISNYYDSPFGRIKPEGATSGTVMDLPKGDGDTREMYPEGSDLAAIKRSGAPESVDPRLKRGGRVMKMAKGGKVKNFEGSFMDMVQDKKLAKKHGMSLKDYEKSSVDAKHDEQRSMKGLKKGGMAKKMAMGGYASGGMSTAMDGMKKPLRPKASGMAKGGKAMAHEKGCKCMACGGMAKMAKGGKVTFGSMKPLPGTKTKSFNMMPELAPGTSTKPAGSKGGLRAKASGAKSSSMMKPLGMTKMAKGGKVRGAGIAQRGTKFIGEV